MSDERPCISVQYSDNIIVITFTENKILETSDINLLDDSISNVIEQSENNKFIFDFCNVKFLSSAVLGLLIRLSKKIYEKQGQMVFCNIQPKLYEVFQITRLTQIFDIFDDLDSAKDALAE